MSQDSEAVEAPKPPNIFESLFYLGCCVTVHSKPLTFSGYFNPHTNPVTPLFGNEETQEQRG